MSNENMSMDEIMNDFELKSFRKGEIIKGKVVSVNNDAVIVNIGHFADGVVSKSEISSDVDFDMSTINADDEIYVMVISTDDGDGNVALSKRKADAIKAWDKLEDIFKENKTFEIKIKEAVKGGLLAYIDGIRVFMPASQCAARRIENIETLVGTTLEVKLIEFNKEDRKVVVSRRVIEEVAKKAEEAKILRTIQAGENRTGKVTKILKFGAFVNIGGVEGLIHINDLAWTRVREVEDILTVGDTVEVYVKEVDLARERLSLSLKDLCENPWTKFAKENKIGETVDAKIVRFIQVGAIAQVNGGVEGLVHISQISEDRINSASDVLKMGQEVKVKILAIDIEKEKLSLSIKEAVDRSVEYEQYNDAEEDFGGLSDLFKDFKF
ncbi:30S ribosomal protein S1 [uncultured Clostridium sp.]|jgi:small subunit ribosomal protein S1|uniref:30S ribosomal protein S1 n=1 Tax=uncultured Clostridium sp. TaxID=59620 RepID=UPI002636C868|nr:30S ribosomal protein S1 [uncultured Clostridium sp.]